jgi:hypothetical protein
MSARAVLELKWNKGISSEFMASAESSLAILSVYVQQQLLLQIMTLSDLHLKGQEGGDASLVMSRSSGQESTLR